MAKARLGLQFSIVLIIAFVVACLTITTATSVYFASTTAAHDGARRLFAEITARVADRISDQMAGMVDLAGLGASLEASSVAVAGDGTRHPLVPFLMRALEQDSGLYSLYVGQADGGFLQAIAVNGDNRILATFKAPPATRLILRAVAPDAEGVRREWFTFFADAATVLGASRIDTPDYDPRTRSWYKQALDRPDTILAEPFVLSSLQTLTLGASRATGRNGAVFCVNVTLKG
ncbi:MAG: chemotaxis protein, partial [Magnetospirillum sp.]|nr:chemotaxis protein [Magnetospirillum sp.]